MLIAVTGMLMQVNRAIAADNSSVGVSATVLAGSCTFWWGGTVSFTLNPATGGTVSGTVTQPRFRCTRNAVYVITDNGGQNWDGANRRLKHAALNEYIPYSFSYTETGTGSWIGSLIGTSMDISSSIVEAAYMNASAGSYTDTVTLTINP